MQDPIYEDGDVGVIINPLGDPNDPNPDNRPKLVAATRPIPYGFPTDLTLAPNGYLYVSYQGLPTLDGQGVERDGGVMVFDTNAIISVVNQYLKTPDGALELRRTPVDDLPGVNGYRSPNLQIDVKADYRWNYLPDDPGHNIETTFGVFDGPFNAPIATGGFPGGIAVSNPVPHPVVYQRVSPASVVASANNDLFPGVNLQPSASLDITATRLDPVDDTLNSEGGDFYFSVDVRSKVSLTIDGVTAKNVSDPNDSSKTLAAFKDVLLMPGVYRVRLSIVDSFDPSIPTYKFVLTAVAQVQSVAQDGTVTYVDGASSSTKGEIVTHIVENEITPPGHTLVDGVDLWDGHLVQSSTDVSIAGRGPDLTFTRTYSSQGSSADGRMGAGWTDNYDARIIQDDGGNLIVIGVDGSATVFDPDGQTNASLAALYDVPSALAATAKFYTPQPGAHTVLVQADPNQAAFDYFSADHTRYHFELEPYAAPYGRVFTLRFIQDSDGNRIDLYYTNDATQDPRVASLPQQIRDKLDADPTTLDAVVDQSNRALLFQYQVVFGQKRITELTGYDPVSPNHDLLGLDIVYGYDAFGNLTSVVRSPTDDAKDDGKTQAYTYTQGDGPTSHNLLTYTDPSNHTTTYVWGSTSDTDGGVNPSPGLDPRYDAFYKVINIAAERVKEIDEPGGQTDKSEVSVRTFSYNFGEGDGNTRTVSDLRPGVAATVYTLDSYGAVTKIEAPEGATTTMVWATPESPHPEAFVDGGRDGKDIVLVSRTDALGQTTSYKYDKNGNVVETNITFAPGLGVCL